MRDQRESDLNLLQLKRMQDIDIDIKVVISLNITQGYCLLDLFCLIEKSFGLYVCACICCLFYHHLRSCTYSLCCLEMMHQQHSFEVFRCYLNQEGH